MPRFVANLTSILPWQTQVVQYPVKGEPGLSYQEGDVSKNYPGKPPVDCLLYRNLDGEVVGILNHYGADYPPLEQKGNLFVLVRRDMQRRRIASTLLGEALSRWDDIDLRQQKYTVAGARFADAYVRLYQIKIGETDGQG